MTFILGFYGPAKVGKTTTTSKLVELFERKYPKLKVGALSFAGPLYDIVSYITDIKVDQLQDQSYKEVIWDSETAPMPFLYGWSPRKLLQYVGTECFRNQIHTNFWVELAYKKCQAYDIAIMADCRFENELKILDYAIELQRENIVYAKNHASAMPPNPELIDMTLNLYKDINLTSLVDDIYNLYESKKTIKGSNINEI